jgi:hypothetical protein
MALRLNAGIPTMLLLKFQHFSMCSSCSEGLKQTDQRRAGNEGDSKSQDEDGRTAMS